MSQYHSNVEYLLSLIKISQLLFIILGLGYVSCLAPVSDLSLERKSLFNIRNISPFKDDIITSVYVRYITLKREFISHLSCTCAVAKRPAVCHIPPHASPAYVCFTPSARREGTVPSYHTTHGFSSYSPIMLLISHT